MPLPVKLSDDLVRAARATAAAADRSIAGQIEHWAMLGRAVEASLRTPDALALKVSRGELESPAITETTRRAVRSAIARVGARGPAAGMHASSGPLYATDPALPGLIVRIESNGRRTPGQLVNDRFRPLSGRKR